MSPKTRASLVAGLLFVPTLKALACSPNPEVIKRASGLSDARKALDGLKG